ncbi:PREDICTED: glycerophosphodiester phosphodiesterase GDPD6-like [Papilio xuthus]|uniref:glycerophosphodiester phosphodiesterase n=1 Tax=Papilio xuthus TaxID=66420 RepID=A0AAJ6Z7S7_PAPXU|nr:PREDICTED: glycerophosphodiester phosphodiesterase GDPD6-like [Papilio xuthus]XP_013166887.1 PREDICTED: glycerophosphodiester phosphodiesterase GDPD6-like [Papilio xuthus]XP_013166888.1 PREDICTED: glycerophosphodiester phosphodiesterase GDPD6-like [Papilio xuthus]
MGRAMAVLLMAISLGCCNIVNGAPPTVLTRVMPRRGADSCKPLVIAHRGASGYVPEHTLGAYALAITMGADYVEPDLVMTADGYLIARHDNELGLTTDVAQRPEFAGRFRTQIVDGRQMTGWFTEDFTLAEIKTLRAVERIPNSRPGNARMDGAFDIPTFQEIIDLVKSMEISEGRTIGIYPEIKHGTHFQHLGLGMERSLVDTFHRNGYIGPLAPAYIQSFEVNNLKELKELTDLRLIQLYGGNPANQPFDQFVTGTKLTYAEMATPEGLREIAKYAHAVGPEKNYIIPRKEDNTLGEPTNFVKDAHAAGLEVHPYTFRAENSFLPAEYRSESHSEAAIGDFNGELITFIATGIDGLFVDQPDVPLRVRDICLENKLQ